MIQPALCHNDPQYRQWHGSWHFTDILGEYGIIYGIGIARLHIEPSSCHILSFPVNVFQSILSQDVHLAAGANQTTERTGPQRNFAIFVCRAFRAVTSGLVDINGGLVGALAVRAVKAVTSGLVDISNGLVDIFIAHREYGFRHYTENFRRMRSF